MRSKGLGDGSVLGLVQGRGVRCKGSGLGSGLVLVQGLGFGVRFWGAVVRGEE